MRPTSVNEEQLELDVQENDHASPKATPDDSVDELKVIQVDPYGERGNKSVVVEYYGLKLTIRPVHWAGIQITTEDRRLEVVPASLNSIIVKSNGSLHPEEVKRADELNQMAARF